MDGKDPSTDTASRRSPAKHQAILSAAIAVFLRDGYSRTSVDTIAAAAGVGKQTVYGHFGNKEQLFLQAVEAARRSGRPQPAADRPDLVSADQDALSALTTVAEHLLRAVLEPNVAALHRLTIAEIAHHPELQQGWRDGEGSQETVATIAAFLADLDRRQELVVPSPERAARQFVHLVATEGRVRSLHGTRTLSAAECKTIAHEAADLIVRAHRPVRPRSEAPLAG
ncbi:TetR/AcrR family transcriptional regulator [Actinoplanes sp. NPDC004185]